MKTKTTIYNAMGIFPGKKLKGKEKYQHLYHYTSFDTFVRIWCTQQLKLGSISGVNDIQEKTKPITVRNLQQMPLAHAFHKIISSYKQLSFTMDYDTYLKGSMAPMMWGYYADKSNGVCIEFDYNKLNFPKGTIKGPIKYVPYLIKDIQLPSDIATIKDLKKFIKRSARNIFLTKHKSWAGENEYRAVCQDIDYLDISDAISAIYVTSYNSIECLMVEKMLEGTDIPVKFIHFNASGKERYAIPLLTESKGYREQVEEALNNPDNAISKISIQAKEHFEINGGSENVSLLKESYKL